MQANKKIKLRRQSAAAAVASTSDPAHSLFQIDSLHTMRIQKRILNPHSVHYSLSSSCWIATITLSQSQTETNGEINKTACFEFRSEGEAKKFCKSYSKPKTLPVSPSCFLCEDAFTEKLRPCHCRNCGVCICSEKCTARWGSRMIPKTYIHSAYQPKTLRVCKSCDWLSNAFCLALLQGRYRDAIQLHATGNVNLRTSFADIRGEGMFPVHCCSLGGNVQLLKWLVDKQLCPLSVKRDSKTDMMLSVKTSSNRTLLDLAMTGKPKIYILRFLFQKGLSITDLADPTLSGRTLEALLKADSFQDGSQQAYVNNALAAVVDPSEGSCATVENACSLCCEKPMDCVLSPCGHQTCCSGCGARLGNCPLCKVKCSVLKIIPC